MSKKIDEKMLLRVEPILAKTKTLQDLTHIEIQIKLLDKDKKSLTSKPFSNKELKAQKTSSISAIMKKYNSKYNAEDIIKYETSAKEVAKELGIEETDEKYKKISFLSFKIDANGNHDITVESNTGLEEGALYSLSNAQSTFKYYNQHNPNKLEKYTYVTKNGKIRYKKDLTILTKEDRIQLLNEVYSNNNRSPLTKLGNDLPGDGYKYRGRGLKQLTGKYNYLQFQTWNNNEFGENQDFINNPDLLLTPIYATRSALYFWKEKGLDELAQKGSTKKHVDAITKIVNSALKGKLRRQDNFQEIWKKIGNKE